MDPSKVKPIADNRKLIQLQSLTDPLKDTEVNEILHSIFKKNNIAI